MYTKNPVTGRNETLVNTSMLKGAVDGVVAKIADKADKGALESLSTYTEGVKTSIASKADKADVEEVSVYVEGMLPKDVYGTMVDAYVGLACKVADADVLEGAAKMAYAANPVKYATSNPNRTDVTKVTDSNYKTGYPIYDAVKSAGSTVELPPFLRLKSWDRSGIRGITSWKTELPNLTDGAFMFNGTGLTSWSVALPNLTIGAVMFSDTPLTSWTTELTNLTDGSSMFKYCTGLTSWTVELPNLTNGAQMFHTTSIEEWNVELPKLTNGSGMFCVGSEYNPDTPAALKRFRGTLPALTSADMMFMNCPLDLESVRCIAETINDVNGLTEDWDVTKRLDICVGYDIGSPQPLHEAYLNAIRDKGWTVTVNGIQQ